MQRSHRFRAVLCGLLALCALSANAQQSQPPERRNHTLVGTFRLHAKFHSQFLPDDRDVLVYLPPDYEENKNRRYPVMYLHDGQNVFDGATSFIPGKEWQVDETAQSLILLKQIPPLIIVGIYNTGIHRADEYTPTPSAKYHIGGKADAYGRLLVEELKPFIDKTYRTKQSAADTGLCGSSLGGLVTLYLGLKYPNVFGKIGAVSPSVWWDDSVILKEVKAIVKKPRLKIWLDMGTHEGEEKDWQSNVEGAQNLRDALIDKGWRSGKDLLYFEAEGAQHNEEAWSKRVEPMLKFLFGK